MGRGPRSWRRGTALSPHLFGRRSPPIELAQGTVAHYRLVQPAARPGRMPLTRVLGPTRHQHGCFLRPVYDLGPTVTGQGSRRSKIIDEGSVMPRLGSYSGCHITRSNSLPSGSANVVWRTAATPGGSASDGSLISLSGLAPRAVSRSISSS